MSTYFLNSSYNIAKYKLVYMGAKLVPIFIPKICWKYSLPTDMRQFFKTMSNNYIMKCALGLTVWNIKPNFFIISIASISGIFVYILSKSTKLRPYFNMLSNLTWNLVKKKSTKTDAGVRIQFILVQLVFQFFF